MISTSKGRWFDEVKAAFQLEEAELAAMPEVFPNLHDRFQEVQFEPLCEAIMSLPARRREADEILREYLQREEYGAARRFVDLSFGRDLARLREIDRIESASLGDVERQLTAAASRVLELNKLDSDLIEARHLSQIVKEHCPYWLRQGRVGTARLALASVDAAVQQQVQETAQRLRAQIAEGRALLDSPRPFEQAKALERLLDKAESYLDKKELRLAESCYQRMQRVLDGQTDVNADLPEFRVPEATDFSLLLTEVLTLLESKHNRHPRGDDWRTFARQWDIDELRTHEHTEVIDCLRALQRVVTASVKGKSVNVGADSPWRAFLTAFRSAVPITFEAQGLRQLSDGAGAVGTLNLQTGVTGSFLEARPDLLNEDPILVLNHKPRQPQELLKAVRYHQPHMENRLVLILSAEPIPAMFRNETLEAFAGTQARAVVLDAQAILAILMTVDRNERRNRMIARMARQLRPEWINPFRSEAGVNEGMFFGREQEIRELLDSTASYAVFGGRKLGKTSLLRQVERIANTRPNTLALYLEIGGHNHESGVQRAVLTKLRETLREQKADRLAALLKPDQPHTFIDQIEELIRADSSLNLLFLLDEADHVLWKLANEPRPSFGWDLRRLTTESRQVRFIFAGFQDLYRAYRVLNGPWQNNLTLMELKTLKDRDTAQLMVQTLGLLGFQFQEPELVHRIVDYTANHASLVQEFCNHLFRLAGVRTGRGDFGVIESAQVEKVFTEELGGKIDWIVDVNVDGESRLKRCLRLLLDAWVYRLFKVQSAQEATTARDLYEFLEDRFGRDETSLALSFEEVDAFFYDLVVLGVLDRTRADRYHLQNRHYARRRYVALGPNRLYQQIEQGLRKLAEDGEGRLRRLWLYDEAHQAPRLSPFCAADEEVWRNTSAGTILVFGDTKLGKTTALRWIQLAALDRTRWIDLKDSNDDVVALKSLLGGSDWESFTVEMQTWAQEAGAKPTDPVYLLVDNADVLATDELLYGDSGQVDLFQQLGLVSVETGGRVKFVLVGGTGLGRFWIENADALRQMVAPISLRRLSSDEVGEWAESHRLVLPDALRQRLHDLTGGHPVALEEFLKMLGGHGRERDVTIQTVERFSEQIQPTGALAAALRAQTPSTLDDAGLEALKLFHTWSQLNGLKIGSILDEDWALLFAEAHPYRRPGDWITELRFLTLWDEFGKPPKGNSNAIGQLRRPDPWR